MSKKKKHKTFIDSVVKYDPEINVIEKEIMAFLQGNRKKIFRFFSVKWGLP